MVLLGLGGIGDLDVNYTKKLHYKPSASKTYPTFSRVTLLYTSLSPPQKLAPVQLCHH